MQFSFTEDQALFKAAVTDIFTSECTPEHVRAAAQSDTGRVPGLWSLLAETGVVGLTAPESAGGLGMNEVDLVGLLEQAGRFVVPEPLIEHTAVAVPALAEAGQNDVLSAASAGTELVTVVNPLVPYALAGGDATWLIAEISGELRLGPVEGVDLEAQPALDRTRRLFRPTLPTGWGERLDADPERAFDRGAVAASSVAVGIARHLITATVEYVSERHQFGKPVGTYQAVKHHLADAAKAVEFAAPVVAYAAWSVAENTADRSRDVSMAKVLASDAVDLAARHALQCHGAIGYTEEYDLQLWLKRAWAISASWGSAGWHRNRVGLALGI